MKIMYVTKGFHKIKCKSTMSFACQSVNQNMKWSLEKPTWRRSALKNVKTTICMWIE